MATNSAATFQAALQKEYGSNKIQNNDGLKGNTVAEQWANFYATEKSHYSLTQAEEVFAELIAVGKVAKVVGTDTPKAIGQAGTQFASGAESALQELGSDVTGGTSDWLYLALRAGKIVLGGLLLIVGLVELTGLTGKAPEIVKTAVKAAPLL